MPYADKPAFRCKECGHLHGPECAGPARTPAACAVCGAGAVFDRRGNRTADPGVWEVLAVCPPERLAELGLAPDAVAAHAPDARAGHAENLLRATAARDQLLAKKARWEADGRAIVQAVWAADDAAVAAEAADDAEAARRKRQEADDLVAAEWTARDADHLAEVERVIARGGMPPARAARRLAAQAAERPGVFDRSAQTTTRE